MTSGFLYLAALFAPPQGVDFVLVGAGYEQNLAVPHNAYGWNGLADLAAAVDRGAHRTYWSRQFWHTRPQPQRLLTGTDLSRLAPASQSRNWVLFVAAHGGCDKQGPYLIADNDSTPSSNEQRIYLSQLLEHLKTLPHEQHKVLVLDAVNFECDATLGMLTNDFAIELARLDEHVAAIPNLVVVCASGADEISWPCPMGGRTTFGHFWIEGVRGAATDDDADGRITLAELMKFTTAQTSHWVAQHYRAQQNPWLLPLGAEGQRRAARVDLAWHDTAYQLSTPTLVPPSTVPRELEEAWKVAAELSARPVPPYVYQPQLWRRYLATLGRYEQLVLAGETHTSERLASDVQSLALQCRHDPTQLLSSLDAQRSSSAFREPASPQLRSQAQDVMQLLARTPPDQWAEAWKQQLAQAGNGGRPLRAEVLQMLVDQAVSDPMRRLSPVRRLAGIIRDPLQPHCPALHLAVMLERDLPAEARALASAPIIAHAIRVRQLAEQATTGDVIGFTQASPRVRPWVADSVAKADGLRREAEDLLFAGVDQHPAAEARFDEAEKLYRQAIADGHVVLAAYAMRDKGLALLPDVSVAVLAFSGECAAGHPSVAELSTEIESAWNEMHSLTHALARPGKIVEGDTSIAELTPVTSLETNANRVDERIKSVEARLEQLWRELASDRFSGERLCLSHIPSLPSMDVQLRRDAAARLLAYVHRRREDLTQALALSVTGHAFSASPALARTTVVQDQATRRGRLALAVFGSEKFAELAGDDADTWAQAQHRLQVYRVDANWRLSLQELSAQIAARWQRLPGAIDHLVVTGDAKLGDVYSCVLADNYARNLPPCFYTKLDDEAAEHLRRRRLSAYLAWQAERTWLDHWYGERDDETPYYIARARALLADAQRVSPQVAAFRDQVARLAVNNQWQLQTPGKAATTPEESLTFTAQLVPAAQENLGGFVSVRVQYGPALAQLAPLPTAWAWPAQEGAISIPIAAGTVAAPQFAHQTVIGSSASVEAYYRGRRVTREVPVELHSTPEFALIEPIAPQTAMIAVDASPDLAHRFGRGSGSVAIVLDCSGSMGPKLGQPFDAKTRYAQATQALSTVLAGLPQGTQLSLWTFGQATGPQKTVKDAENTIRCLRRLAAWDPADKAAYSQLVKAFSYPAVEPWNESAVVHAMLAAKDDLAKTQGSKTLIVITDGIDNRFEQDVKANPRKLDVAAGLGEAFRGSGIAINVVGFQVATHEEQAARDQFSVIETLDPPGRFFSVQESDELLAALQGALDQRLRYWVEDYNRRIIAGESVEGSAPALSTASLPRDRASALPGQYRLRVMAGKPLERSLVVAGGDFLLAQLRPDGDQLAIERGSVLDRLYPHVLRENAAGWNVALLKTSLTDGAAAVDLAFEREADPQELQLAHVSPGELWWECQLAGDDAARHGVRATRTFESGLPGWRIECLTMPGEALPPAITGSLVGWWVDDDAATQRPQLVAGRDFRNLGELIGRSINLDGETIRIRDIRWQTAESGGELLVVLDGPPQASVWVRLHGLEKRSSQHRHYRSLSRYVGLFDLPLAELPTSGWRMEFLSLSQLQRTAEERGTHIRFDNILFERVSAAP